MLETTFNKPPFWHSVNKTEHYKHHKYVTFCSGGRNIKIFYSPKLSCSHHFTQQKYQEQNVPKVQK